MKLVSMITGLIVILVFLSFLFSWPMMMLWNGCLVGAVDGIHEVTWLQAWGINVLCAILFNKSGMVSK